MAELKRCQVDVLEYHLFAFRTDKQKEIGPFDPEILSAHDHVDFSLCVLASGGTIYMEPESKVSYDKDVPLRFGDIPYYFMRWSPIWVEPSIKRFGIKWWVHFKPGHEAWFYTVRGRYGARWAPWLRLKRKRLLWRWVFAGLDNQLLEWIRRRYWTSIEGMRTSLFQEAVPSGYSVEKIKQCQAFGKVKFSPEK